MSEINDPDPPIKTFVKGPLDLWMGAIVVVTRHDDLGARMLAINDEPLKHGTECGLKAKKITCTVAAVAA